MLRKGAIFGGPSQGDQVDKEIRVRITVERILNIDISAQSFQAEFFLEASWLSHEPELHTSRHVIADEENTNHGGTSQAVLRIIGSDVHFFHPHLYLRNILEWQDKSQEYIEIYPDPKNKHAVVCYRLVGKADFHAKMNLHLFPLDTQKLSIQVSSRHEAPRQDVFGHEGVMPRGESYAGGSYYGGYAGSMTSPVTKYRVLLVHNCTERYKSLVRKVDFVLQNEYALKDKPTFETDLTEKSESASARQYSVLTISSIVTRERDFWLHNVVAPMYFLTLTNVAAFAVPTKAVSDRCSKITVTLMMTTVAYIYSLKKSKKLLVGMLEPTDLMNSGGSERLPTVQYLTLIDWYVIINIIVQVCFVMTFVVLGAHYEVTRSREAGGGLAGLLGPAGDMPITGLLGQPGDFGTDDGFVQSSDPTMISHMAVSVSAAAAAASASANTSPAGVESVALQRTDMNLIPWFFLFWTLAHLFGYEISQYHARESEKRAIEEKKKGRSYYCTGLVETATPQTILEDYIKVKTFLAQRDTKSADEPKAAIKTADQMADRLKLEILDWTLELAMESFRNNELHTVQMPDASKFCCIVVIPTIDAHDIDDLLQTFDAFKKLKPSEKQEVGVHLKSFRGDFAIEVLRPDWQALAMGRTANREEATPLPRHRCDCSPTCPSARLGT